MLSAGRRGQTLPMWTISVLAALTLTFFVFNYANTVRWQIRAQNAADSSAAALLAKDAQAANSLTSLMYALDLEDFKLSTVNNTITALLQNNTVCLLSVPCSANLTTLVSDYTKYVTGPGPATASCPIPGIALIVCNITGFVAALPGGSIQDQLGLKNQPNPNIFATGFLNSLLPSNGSGGVCVKISTDCGFSYSVSVISSTPLVVDVVACRNVPTMLSEFMHLGSSTFKVVGRSTVELNPLNVTQNVGSLIDATGNPNLHSLIPLGVSIDAINLANLSLTTGMLVPTAVSPLNAANVPC